MNSNRRHESLIPLSREHHYGLLVCLRIHRGIQNHQVDVSWLRERAEKVIRFFESDLKTHFGAEEEIVFPAMSGVEDSKATIDRLVDEHRNLEGLVQRLRKARDPQLAPLLRKFADLLEAHIRTEERVFFPQYELCVSPELARDVGMRVLAVIGTAKKPKHPELLE
jgi:iron-sulfur cluster repair protein YtfE (RIC family)